MSSLELERVEVMGRVASGTLKLVHAAEMLELSYRQTKRLWRRYRKKGPEGLKHAHAGQCSNRGKPKKVRRRVLQLIQEEVLRNRRDQIWANTGGRTSGRGRRDRNRSRDVAAVDAGRRVVEPAAKENKAPSAQRSQGTFGGTGGVGWQL